MIFSGFAARRTTGSRAASATMICFLLVADCSGQTSFLTSRGNNQRTAANTNETQLTPANVNANTFGKLFSHDVDYQVLAQPLYVPRVRIPDVGTHNVVYVATMNDTVYAFDADSAQGANAEPIWSVNFLAPAYGINIATYLTHTLPCTNDKNGGPGFNQEGIVSTPVIDRASQTMYVVAKTVDNGVVHHRLHALDIATGEEKFGGPIVISATFASKAGKTVTFNSLHQKNRPGLLLLNGTLYMAFGSNSCNDHNHSWVLAYNATSLSQVGVFDANPDHGLSSIWQSGQGISADSLGNIYVSTAEGKFDIPQGGQGYGSSILKLSANPLAVVDYFTPWNQAYLSEKDLDLSSNGVLILPDQPGPHPHVMIAAGKQGTIYVLNRDNLGHYNQDGDIILQELTMAVKKLLASPTYWNGMVYFTGDADPIKGFSVANGLLSLQPIITTRQKYVGAHSPSISANGSTNGILWAMSGQNLYAFDATSLELLYNTVPKQIPRTSHFATQTVINGKVYVGTETTLEVYGLLQTLKLVGGGSQTGSVATTLASPIRMRVTDPYSGAPVAGANITFSDGGQGGRFNPPNATADSFGNVSTSYTLPTKPGNYTVNASGSGMASVSFTETAMSAGPVRLPGKSSSGH